MTQGIQGILVLVQVILTGMIVLMMLTAMLLTIFKQKQNRRLALVIAVNALALAVLYYFINGLSHWWCVTSLIIAVYWFYVAWSCKKAADRNKEAEKKE